jgi:SAM-dependent methyltransferase
MYGAAVHRETWSGRTAAAQAVFFLPYLASGTRLLDCGCGPGSITVGLAEAVVPGEVVGVDRNASVLEAARARAAESGANIRFEEGDIYALPFADGAFDAAFAHGVLEHIGDPRAALAEMWRVVKPGGVAGVRSPDYTGLLIAPPNPLLEESHAIHGRIIARNGGNMNVGKALRGLMRAAGFVNVVASVTMDQYGSPEATRRFGETVATYVGGPTFAETAIAEGWATRAELALMSAAWRAWGEHPDAFYAVAWGEAVGWKD